MESQYPAGAPAPVVSTCASKTTHAALVFILVTIFLDILGGTILIPVAAYIARQYDTSALAVGLLSVIYSAAQFVFAPILGQLSDRFGRRPVLLISVFGSAIGYFLFGVGGALWVLFLSRLIDGITGGNISTAQAYIADITPPDERTKNFAYIGMAYGLGFILGPAIGGILGQVNITFPAFAAGVFSLFSVIFAFFKLPESLAHEQRAKSAFRLSDLNPVKTIIYMAKQPLLGILFTVTFLFDFAFNGMVNNLPVYTIEKFDIPPLGIAIMLVLGGIANVIIQGAAIQRLAPHLTTKILLIAGLIIQVGAYLFIGFTPWVWSLFPLYTLFSIGTALTFPALATLVSNQASPVDLGKATGVSASLTSLASILGPLCASLAYDHISPATPYWIGAGLVSIACMMVSGIKPEMHT